MDISSLLTFIVFCCLLFLEGVTEGQKTFEDLDAGLTAMSSSLKRLLSKIHELGVTADDNDEIDKKINKLIEEKVDKNFKSLRSKGKQGVKGGIRITQGVDEIRDPMNSIIRSKEKPSREALLKLLKTIETGWDNDIQPQVDEAVK